MESAIEPCVTCGEPAGTPFCASCGERRSADRPHTLHALGDELWDAFSPADGRIARTLALLFRRPGELTVAYMRGVRLPYTPPLRLFLLLNVFYFVVLALGIARSFDAVVSVVIASAFGLWLWRALHRGYGLSRLTTTVATCALVYAAAQILIPSLPYCGSELRFSNLGSDPSLRSGRGRGGSRGSEPRCKTAVLCVRG